MQFFNTIRFSPKKFQQISKLGNKKLYSPKREYVINKNYIYSTAKHKGNYIICQGKNLVVVYCILFDAYIIDSNELLPPPYMMTYHGLWPIYMSTEAYFIM